MPDGHPRDSTVTVLEGFREIAPANWTITHARGADIGRQIPEPAGETLPDGQPKPALFQPASTDQAMLTYAARLARDADWFVAVIGDTVALTGESRSTATLDLQGALERRPETLLESDRRRHHQEGLPTDSLGEASGTCWMTRCQIAADVESRPRSFSGFPSAGRIVVSTDNVNWAGNLTYAAEAILRPANVDELQGLVARLPRVRALGTRHSFNDIADTPGALISLAGFDPDIRIDPTAMTASVTGGTRFGVLISGLQAQGFALHNTGSLPHISVAGATATGTHGSGDGNGILSTAISAVELVAADGSLVRIDRSSEHLLALAVGLGAFGIITRITVDIQPSYLVRQDVYRYAPWETILGRLDEVMASAYSVSLLADFASPTVMQVWLKTRLGAGEHPEVARTLFGAAWYDDSDELAPGNVNQRASVPGPWSERMPHFRLDRQPSNGGEELQSEYYVSREHGAQALQVLRTLGARISPHLLIAEIRTASADTLWLSPAYERDVLCIGFTWAKHRAEVAALLPVIEEALAPFAPRPHWGKLFHFGADVIGQRFPRLDDFKAVRKHYDPEGKFWNPFLQSTLGTP